MPRHRRSPGHSTQQPWSDRFAADHDSARSTATPEATRALPRSGKRQLVIRVAAMLTLVLGVTGGLFLDDDKDKAQQEQSVAYLQTYAEAELTEQDMLAERKSLQAKENALEQARLAAEAAAEAERKRAAEEAARKARRTTPSFGPIPASCQVYSGNRAIGCTLMLDAGYELDQMPCLDKLWTKESGWNHLARNKSSGAYGIAQALPGTKMAEFGDDWETNPATQIKWGLSYIKKRYSTPCGGWEHFLNVGWY